MFMSDVSKLIAYMNHRLKDLRDLENRELFQSWLNMSREDVLDFRLRDWFAERGLMRLKP